MKDFNTKVKTAVQKWENNYRREVRELNYDPIQEYVDPYADDTLEEDRERAEEALDKQIMFIKHCIAFKMIGGETPENLKRIKTFLSYQHYEKRYFPEQKDPAFMVFFWGGCSGGVHIKFDNLNEFDFTDSWSEERYEIVCIYNNKWKRRTKKRISKLSEHIRDDFEFDGGKVEIKLEPVSSSDKGVCFSLNVED
jgi:hypothetical protein